MSDLHQIRSQGVPFNEHTLIARRGQGTRVIAADGREYLDAMSGFWFMPFGYADPELIAVMTDAAQQLSGFHLFEVASEPAIRYADELLASMPPLLRGTFLYAVSGSDAVELALRVACTLRESRPVVLAHFERAYHGATYLTEQLGEPRWNTWPSEMRISPERQLTLPSPMDAASAQRAIEMLEKALNGPKPPTVVISEPIQGAGGVIVPPSWFHSALRDVCDRFDVIWIGDEISTAFGATGYLLAFEHDNVWPDILTLGKRMAGGLFPLAGVVLSQRLADCLLPAERHFEHGHSLSGHPIGCELARSVLTRVRDPGLLSSVRARGQRLMEGLTRTVGSLNPPMPVRGRGLMVSVETPSGAFCRRCVSMLRQRGLFLISRGKFIAIAPPLIISDEECDFIINTMGAILSDAEPQPGTPCQYGEYKSS